MGMRFLVGRVSGVFRTEHTTVKLITVSSGSYYI